MNEQTPTCIPCGIRPFRRNTYFNGKLLVERDFKDEQAYLIGKDWLHNSLLHGVGTVCGLKVLAHPNPECQDKYVYIEPGVALDCCGREIIVTEKLLVPVKDLIEENDVDADEEGSTDLFISLCYEELPEEKIPVILPDCDCADGNAAYNRVREGFRVKLFAETPGKREGVNPPLKAQLDWHHTIVLDKESPRTLAVDGELQQLYIATQGLPDSDFLGERLYVYRTDTHDLVTAVNAGLNPTDLALSLLGDRIYLATMLDEDGDGTPERILAFFKESAIRADPEPAKTISLEGPTRLIVSPNTGALFAFVLDNGIDQAVLHSWTNESINVNWLDSGDPPPAPSNTLTFNHPFSDLDGAAMLSITLNGKYLFLADANNDIVRVVDVATFSDVTPMQADGVTPVMEIEGHPLAVFTSRDSKYLYVLWQKEVEEEVDGVPAVVNYARLTRYRLDVSAGSLHLIPDGRGGEWPATPHDLAVSPDERWAYVLESEDEQSRVQAIAIEEIAGPVEPELDELLGTHENVSGRVHYQRLAVQGGRLYVAADDAATDVQPDRGLVAILDVEEAACDDLFTRALDGCPTCNENEDEGHCVIVAHIPEYKLNAPIKDPDKADEDDNSIDNLTHRPLIPSSNNIVEVIRCMLEQGIAEGIPGPRGAAGPEGRRGPGITEVVTATLEPGSDATAELVAITDDPEGDLRLELGIPTGQGGQDGQDGEDGDDGDPGARGPGITEVNVTTLSSGSNATAALVPIAGDPEGDFRLNLGIPRGESGGVEELDLTRVERLSWEHGQQFGFSDFLNFAVDPSALDENVFGDPSVLHPPGLVIAFSRDVNVQSILTGVDTPSGDPPIWTTSEVFQLFVRHEEVIGGGNARIRRYCECQIPDVVYQPVLVEPDGAITEVVTLDPRKESALAVRIVFTNGDLLQNILNEFAIFNPALSSAEVFFRVVFRADFAMDLQSEPNAIDGNHIDGNLPSGNGRPGNTFESWFTVEAG